MPENSIMVLKPYLYEGTWVFDDAATGLVREAFVAGVPDILESLLHLNDIPIEEAASGFLLYFSPTPFPGYQMMAQHDGEEFEGNWYKVAEEPEVLKDGVVYGNPDMIEMRGWLCPALFKYFDKAPPFLYAAVKKL
jgi:hypothetical protein